MRYFRVLPDIRRNSSKQAVYKPHSSLQAVHTRASLIAWNYRLELRVNYIEDYFEVRAANTVKGRFL